MGAWPGGIKDEQTEVDAWPDGSKDEQTDVLLDKLDLKKEKKRKITVTHYPSVNGTQQATRLVVRLLFSSGVLLRSVTTIPKPQIPNHLTFKFLPPEESSLETTARSAKCPAAEKQSYLKRKNGAHVI